MRFFEEKKCSVQAYTVGIESKKIGIVFTRNETKFPVKFICIL